VSDGQEARSIALLDALGDLDQARVGRVFAEGHLIVGYGRLGLLAEVADRVIGDSIVGERLPVAPSEADAPERVTEDGTAT
jgi:hypothetical protein